MKVSIVHADTCLSDYWGGHHRPHVQIPCTRQRMSFAEIRDLIRSEIAQGAVADIRRLSGVGPAALRRSLQVLRADHRRAMAEIDGGAA